MKEVVAAVYVLNFVAGTALSWRRDIPARPFGLQTRLGVRTDVVLGLGCGLAAPWPMIIALLRFRSGGKLEPWLWTIFLAGALSEPVTHRAFIGGTSPAESFVVGANLVLPVVAIAALQAKPLQAVTLP